MEKWHIEIEGSEGNQLSITFLHSRHNTEIYRRQNSCCFSGFFATVRYHVIRYLPLELNSRDLIGHLGSRNSVHFTSTTDSRRLEANFATKVKVVTTPRFLSVLAYKLKQRQSLSLIINNHFQTSSPVLSLVYHYHTHAQQI